VSYQGESGWPSCQRPGCGHKRGVHRDEGGQCERVSCGCTRYVTSYTEVTSTHAVEVEDPHPEAIGGPLEGPRRPQGVSGGSVEGGSIGSYGIDPPGPSESQETPGEAPRVVARERVAVAGRFADVPGEARDLLIRCQHKLTEAAGFVAQTDDRYAREFSELSAQIHEYRYGEKR
jgi:hypothetical protein